MKKHLIIVAVIVGIMCIGWNGLAQQPPPRKPAPSEKPAAAEPRGPLAGLKDFLNLTPEQEAKIIEMRKARQAENQAFRDQMQKLRGELNPLLRDQKADPKKINGLIDEISKLRAERMKKAVAERNPLAKILTPEQLEKLKTARGPFMGGMMGGRGFVPGLRPMGRGRFMGPMGRSFMSPRGYGGFGMMAPRGGRAMRMMRRNWMRRGWWW